MARAFLIGAGATKAQYNEAPLVSDFFDILKSKNGDLYHGILNSLPHNTITGKLYDCNVEDLVTKALEFPQSNQNSFFDCLYQAIYEILAKPTGSDEETLKKYEQSTIEPPSIFKNLLNDDRLNQNDFFMTLNYDLFLDREILRFQKKIDYGIGTAFINSKAIPISSDEFLSVYHLHGSLNWEVINDRVNLYLGAQIPKYVRSKCNLCIVPPGKKDLNPILKSIWEKAERRLLKADELIIIGCSMNPTDVELISLVKKFIESKGDNKVKVIFKSDTEFNSPIYSKIIGTGVKQYIHGFTLKPPVHFKNAIEFIFC